MAEPKKKTTAKKTKARKQPQRQDLRSFKRSANPFPFFGFRFTVQTVYWIIISALILALGVWMLSLTIKVQRIYDQIEISTTGTVTRKE